MLSSLLPLFQLLCFHLSIQMLLLYTNCNLSAHLCSLEDLVAGAWEVQDHMDRLADAADNPRGLERGLATMSAVADQRTRLQVSHVALDCNTVKSLAILCSNQCLQVTCPMCFGSLLDCTWRGMMHSFLQRCVKVLQNTRQ